MQYNQEQFEKEYRIRSEAVRSFCLPIWEDFPDIELYMDQLVILINRYLYGECEERIVTASMINNYVKMRIMPPPVKKRYGRAHLAYLVVICLLKDALGTAAIQELFPPDMEGELLREKYNSFAANQRKAYAFVADNIDRVAFPLLQEKEHIADRIYDLVTQTCVSASITKRLAEQFLFQPEKTET